ncbi:MAG: hypothetical protein WA081_01045 [Desulfosalsimonadaceae bacterium]
MEINKNQIINHLDEKDRNKLFFFAEVLFNHSKYQNLRDEIGWRRKEIKENNIISHQDFWRDL